MIQSAPSLTRYAWLSVITAVLTIGMKTVAYLLTGSVGILSEAVESLVNLAGAAFALVMLSYAARPADQKHPFGHVKAEYFSSGFEGLLILCAAIAIGYTAITRLIHPQPLEQMGLGLIVSTVASAINLATARIMLNAGKRYQSITLEADGQHLMADVWTAVGVLVGVACVWLTGWLWLDSLIALLVSLQIAVAGTGILKRSFDGLMDAAIPETEMQKITEIMKPFEAQGIIFHGLLARQAASARFITVHMLFPGDWTVHHAHSLAEDFEGAVRTALPNTTITTHLESLEDARSFSHGQDEDAPSSNSRSMC